MKKTVKNLIHKPESERSKKEKLIRDIAFFGVVVYAATLTFLLGSAQADQTIAESEESFRLFCYFLSFSTSQHKNTHSII